jgi:hypothetical protein
MNPYGPPTTGQENLERYRHTREPLPRNVVAMRLLIGGFMGGAALGTFGYILLITFIELLLTPPFVSPPNYGQFQIVVIGVGFYMSMFGAALAVIPYVRWLGYFPIHVLGVLVIWTIDAEFFLDIGWDEAPIAATLFLFSLPTFVAIICDYWSRRRCTGSVRVNGS